MPGKMNEILIPINIYYFVKDRGERVLIRSFISKNLHFLFFFLLTAIKLIVIKFVKRLIFMIILRNKKDYVSYLATYRAISVPIKDLRPLPKPIRWNKVP